MCAVPASAAWESVDIRSEPASTKETPRQQEKASHVADEAEGEDLPLLQPELEALHGEQDPGGGPTSSGLWWGRPWQLELREIIRLAAPATIQVSVVNGITRTQSKLWHLPRVSWFALQNGLYEPGCLASPVVLHSQDVTNAWIAAIY